MEEPADLAAGQAGVGRAEDVGNALDDMVVAATCDDAAPRTSAGLLDADDPETAIRREAEEELGVTVGPLERVGQIYMSPGLGTEYLHVYAAPYTPADRTGAGGGLADDGEEFE